MVEMTPSFELQIKALDEDHQVLIDHANRIFDVLENIQDADDGRDCEQLVSEFVKLSKQHFAREEALLKSVDYPDVGQHRDHHRSLYSKMDHLIEFSSAARENPLARESLKKELQYFLLDDVITADMEFKDFINEKEDPSSS